jgi:flavodoxin
MKKSEGLIVYSSKTGNTKKLAEGIRRGLEEEGFGVRLSPVEENPPPAGAAWILAGYWADRGNADAKALEYIGGLQGQNVGVFGTLGAYPDSEHAQNLAKKVEAFAAEKNTALGSFICQGKVDPALIEKFKNLPPGNPHAMNEERRKRHEEAAKHPNEQDIADAVKACLAMAARARDAASTEAAASVEAAAGENA